METNKTYDLENSQPTISMVKRIEHADTDPLLEVLNDIAMSLRIMSGRSKVTKVPGKDTYKDFYFSQSDE